MWLPLALLLASLSSARGGIIMGVDLVPLSRGDLTWVEEGRTSGTAVGELDGLLRPSAMFYAGARWGPQQLHGSVGVARITHTTWTQEGSQQSHVGALRLAATWRRWIGTEAERRVAAFLDVGAYGVIPSARIRSQGYAEAEQQDADETAAGIRKTIGALGVVAGPGFGISLAEEVRAGGHLHLVGHLGQRLDEEAFHVSVMCVTETALFLEVAF